MYCNTREARARASEVLLQRLFWLELHRYLLTSLSLSHTHTHTLSLSLSLSLSVCPLNVLLATLLTRCSPS